MTASRPTFYRGRSRRRGRRGAKLGLGLALAGLAVVGYVLLGGETGLLSVRRDARAVERLEARITEVERGTDDLRQATVELAEPGSFMLEKVAREQYLMSRPGERVLHVLEEPLGTEETTATLPATGPRP